MKRRLATEKYKILQIVQIFLTFALLTFKSNLGKNKGRPQTIDLPITNTKH